MTFFGKQRSNSLLDQQAHFRSQERELQKRKKTTFFIFRLVISFVGLVILFGLVTRLPSYYTKVAKPFNNLQTNFYQSGNLNLNNRTNLLLVTTRDKRLVELALASYEMGKKKIEILKIPPTTLVSGQDGPIQLQDLLVYQNKQPANIDQFSAAAMEVIGYIPDGYILLNDNPDWISSESLNDVIAKSSFTPSFFLSFKKTKAYLDKHLLTNLTIAEFYELTSGVKKVLPERFDLIDLGKYATEEGFIDRQAMINEIGVKLNDSKIVEGNFAVEIVNASGIEGIGLVTKNIINNLGANVVLVSSSDETISKNQLILNKKDNYLGDRVSGIFEGDKKKEDLGSVDLKIIIGQNFGELFNF